MYGAPLGAQSRKLLLLGSGELGKEIAIEAQRLGVEVIAVDAYDHAPAMQVAHRSHVIPMTSSADVRRVIEYERPHYIVPEIEAIATETLLQLEQEGYTVIPSAKAAHLTLNREGIRKLVAEKLGLPTARFAFADNLIELRASATQIGFPCVIKPIMSSSGKGQSICKDAAGVETSWEYAMSNSRTKGTRVIVEEFISFHAEITLLTVRTNGETLFCPPIGHLQRDGDYIESWQPHPITDSELGQAKQIAKTVTDALGGVGIFGVELFLTEHGVLFSEVSPRPHDTGLVTLVTQELSEFALHVRAVLGYPIPDIRLITPGASVAIKATEESHNYNIEGVVEALATPYTHIRLFGKPFSRVGRRMGVVVSGAPDIDTARTRAKMAAQHVRLVQTPDSW